MELSTTALFRLSGIGVFGGCLSVLILYLGQRFIGVWAMGLTFAILLGAAAYLSWLWWYNCDELSVGTFTCAQIMPRFEQSVARITIPVSIVILCIGFAMILIQGRRNR